MSKSKKRSRKENRDGGNRRHTRDDITVGVAFLLRVAIVDVHPVVTSILIKGMYQQIFISSLLENEKENEQ